MLRFVVGTATQVAVVNMIATFSLAQIVIWDRSLPGVLQRAILVPESDFHESSLVQVAQAILRQYGTLPFIHVRVVTEERQARDFPRLSNLTFESWLRLHQMMSKVSWQLAEIVAINGRGVLRIRDHGNIRRVVLNNTADPLRYQIDHSEFEILHISVPSTAVIPGQSNHEFHVFARAAPPLDGRMCARLFKALRKDLSLKMAVLSVGSDHWFVYDEEFPIYYLFSTEPPPDKRSWGSTTSIKCFGQTEHVTCY